MPRMMNANAVQGRRCGSTSIARPAGQQRAGSGRVCSTGSSVRSIIGTAPVAAAAPISTSSAARRRGSMVVAAAASSTEPLQQKFTLPDRSLMTTSIMAPTVDAFLKEMDEASTTGVDVLELRIDFIKDFDTERDLRRIMAHAKLPYIVTYRPTWEW